MGFMKPEIVCGVFWSVENNHGESSLVPSDLVPNKPTLKDFEPYVEGKPTEFTRKDGIFARMSAPGYMDCTEWDGPFPTRHAAELHLAEFYGEE
jgi:hypothetical protein